jgi:hypothetical protein
MRRERGGTSNRILGARAGRYVEALLLEELEERDPVEIVVIDNEHAQAFC